MNLLLIQLFSGTLRHKSSACAEYADLITQKKPVTNAPPTVHPELQLQQRKELTGDEGHQFPEGTERTKAVDAMFEPYMPLFDPDNLGQTEGAHCEIDTGDAEPVVNQPYRLSPNERDIIRTEVAKMLKMGVVRPSQSLWGSLPVLARKPDGSVRFCIDYRAVNKVTKPDAMPIPRIDDTLAAL